MPAIYTHYFFAQKVYQNLPPLITKQFCQEKQLYEIFAQSFDFLFYYKFYSYRGKFIRNLGKFCHHHNSQAYLLNIITYLEKHQLTNKADMLAYLNGSLTHYILDTTMHPYINFLSKFKKNTNGNHRQIEFNIDAYYYELNHQKPFYQYDLPNHLLRPKIFNHRLKMVLNKIYETTFNVKEIGNIYNQSYNETHYLFRLVRVDKYGIKKFFYQLLDLITGSSDRRFACLSYHIKPVSTAFLNQSNESWFNLANSKQIYRDSWEELFVKAQNQCVALIKSVDLYFHHQISKKQLVAAIPNLDYGNGMPLKTTKIKFYRPKSSLKLEQ